MLDYDEMVFEIMRTGVPKARAEQRARELCAPIATSQRLPSDALEDEHVDAADRLVRSLGGHVVRNSQKRASKVTPGIPDRMYFFPRHRRFCFWEAKKVGGKQSGAQKLFQEMCDACDAEYVVGPKPTLEDWLEVVGIAARDDIGNLIPTATGAL